MRRHRHSIWTKGCLSIAISVVVGICIVFLCTAVFSVFTFFLMDSMEFKAFFSTAAFIVGAFFCGYMCGRFRRKRGLVEGIQCGILMYTIVSIIGVIAGKGILSLEKLLILIAFCALGGVIGVNSKRPKKLME